MTGTEDKPIDRKKLKACGEELLEFYRTEKGLRGKSLIGEKFQDEEEFRERVREKFFTEIKEACMKTVKKEQKIALRQALIVHIENLSKTLGYFQTKSKSDRKLIYASLTNVNRSSEFEELERAYFSITCCSKVIYHLILTLLNKFFEDEKDNDYKATLWQLWDHYHQLLYESMIAEGREEPYPAAKGLPYVMEMILDVKQAALRGEDTAYHEGKPVPDSQKTIH